MPLGSTGSRLSSQLTELPRKRSGHAFRRTFRVLECGLPKGEAGLSAIFLGWPAFAQRILTETVVVEVKTVRGKAEHERLRASSASWA